MNLWPAASGSVPFVFDNDVADQLATYARVSITTLPSEQHTLGAPGNRKWLRSGMINVKVYTPANRGRVGADVLVSAARAVFEGSRFGVTAGDDGVVCYEASAKEATDESDAQYWIVLVSVAFEFFETS